MGDDIKQKLICSVKCPECDANLNIIKETEILEPAVKAEKKERFIVAKNTQTTLE